MTVKRVKRYSKEWRKKVSSGWFTKGFIPWNKGIPMREESKKKLSQANKGKPSPNKGKKMSEKQRLWMAEAFEGEHRSPKTEFKNGQGAGNKNNAKKPGVGEKISKAKKGIPHFNQRGENHPLWKGGMESESVKARKTLEYKMWREAIFLRDNWTCQKCKKRGKKLVAHHIYNFANFSNMRINLKNGATLCEDCHKKFHTLFGIKNISTAKFKKFLML